MTIEFHCPGCDKLLRTADDRAGLRAKCPDCGGSIQVPGRPDEPLELDLDDDQPLVADDPHDEFSRYFGGGGRSTTRPARTSTAATKPCPMCGEQIQAAAIKCRYCGEIVSRTHQPPGYAYEQPTSGAAVASMVLGILGLVTFCFWFLTIPLSLLAVVLAGVALQQFKYGRASGQGMAIAGLVCGLIPLVLWLMGVVLFAGAMGIR